MLLIHKITGQLVELDTLLPDQRTGDMWMSFTNHPDGTPDAMLADRFFADFRFAKNEEIDAALAEAGNTGPGRLVH